MKEFCSRKKKSADAVRLVSLSTYKQLQCRELPSEDSFPMLAKQT